MDLHGIRARTEWHVQQCLLPNTASVHHQECVFRTQRLHTHDGACSCWRVEGHVQTRKVLRMPGRGDRAVLKALLHNILQ